MRRRLWLLAPLAFAVLSACGQTPEETEKARGVLKGANVVLAMSVLFVVAALGLVGAALAFDRLVRTRKALAEAPPVVEEEAEEPEEVVAGIRMGRASVPRWLYGAYVLIPVFALAYVFSNVAVAPAKTEKKLAPKPSGPCTKCEISAAAIKFSTSKLIVAAGKPITVSFQNNDAGIPHTFTVYKSKAEVGKSPIADTGTFSGGSRDAKFTSPSKGGSFYFDCTVHPTSMFGTVVGT
jgi:plastocyanin